MGWSTVLFDLDGTLTDSQEGITKSVQHALARFGIPVEDPSTLRHFIGPPLGQSFCVHYGFAPEEAAQAVETFRERFTRVGWRENAVYPGVEDMLRALHRAGKRLVLTTSKPEVQALRIMDHFGLSKYFDCICGPALDAPAHYGKAEVIGDALGRCAITDTAEVIMVGDRRHDVEGAHALSIPCVGVLYGYGDRAELADCGADYFAEDPAALERLLLA